MARVSNDKRRNPSTTKTPALRIAGWKVRTVRPGATNDLQQLNDARKTAVIDRELQRLSIDIACLQETRLPDSGFMKEANYTFFWQGRPTGEPRQPTVEPTSEGTERIISLRISTPTGPVTIFSVYAPTLCSSPEAIDAFYEVLDEAVNSTKH
ncbi:uncharacterized protein [Montipora capricornis]|uniref:uncharacterized protein n=1 Tax=Montipora foliosa TaxID=591990 RepID=UPI0035F10592